MRPIRTDHPTEHPVSTNPSGRTFNSADTPYPNITLLGRLPYTVLVSNAGSGISRHGEIAINRWRVDGTRDDYGQWCYLRDVSSGKIWSAGHQPVCAATLLYEVAFTADAATIRRRDDDVETVTEIRVLPDLAAEVRRVTVKNLSAGTKEIELTSYQEVVLATTISDRGHKAFGNLFVQTEWLPESRTLLAMRRPRSAIQKPVWCGHSIGVENAGGAVSVETDRSVFIGRGRSARNPVAMDNPGDLKGNVGAVLDPVFAIRTKVDIAKGDSATVVFTTFFANDRDDALNLAETFQKRGVPEATAFPLAKNLTMTLRDPEIYQQMAGRLLYGTTGTGSSTASRADLIAIGLTGEWPIILASISTAESFKSLGDVVAMHRYWHLKGVDCDLVIVSGGSADLPDAIRQMLAVHRDDDSLEEARGAFVIDKSTLTATQLSTLDSVARIQIDCDRQTLDDIANV